MASRRILIAFNGSPLSRKSLDIGIALASVVQAEIGIVTVVNPKEAVSTVGGILPKELLADMKVTAQRKLAAVVEKIDSGAGAQDFLVEGDPATEIIRAAEEWGAQMIVLGFHPQSRLERAVFGSTTEAVIQRALCPVLLVPEATTTSCSEW